MQGPINVTESGPYHHCAVVKLKFITLLSHRDSGIFVYFWGVKNTEERDYSHGTTGENLQTCITPSVERTIKIPTKQKYLDDTSHFYSDSIP